MDMKKLADVGCRLYNRDKIQIGTCIDMPSAIMKASLDCSEIEYVEPYGGELETIDSFNDRLRPRNCVETGLHYVTPAARYLRQKLSETYGDNWASIIGSVPNHYCIRSLEKNIFTTSEADYIFEKVQWIINETLYTFIRITFKEDVTELFRKAFLDFVDKRGLFVKTNNIQQIFIYRMDKIDAIFLVGCGCDFKNAIVELISYAESQIKI